VTWSLVGDACAKSDCERISQSGFYTAPAKPPEPTDFMRDRHPDLRTIRVFFRTDQNHRANQMLHDTFPGECNGRR